MTECLVINVAYIISRLMGNKPIKQNDHGLDDLPSLIKQYTPSFQLFKANPSFLINLITQNSTFVKNLLQLFPQSHLQFESYLQMIIFLRREDAKFHYNAYSLNNSASSSLIDRFFMIILKKTYSEYQQTTLSIQQLDSLLLQYFRLFVENPQKGSISKILKFMRIEQQTINLKQFSSTLREYFPQVHKHLKDFYQNKFSRMQKNGLLLNQFKSKISKNDLVILALKIPRMSNPQIFQLYNTEKYGLGFHSIEKRLLGYTGPWLLLIQHTEKNQKNQKQTYILGTYQNGPIKNVATYQGDVTGFMFGIHPTLKFLTTDKGEGGNHYFYINSMPQQKTKKRKGFGFGGDRDKTHFKLWLDQDLDRSTVFNGKDQTYGYGALASSTTEKLNIRRMQIWGLGSQFNVDDQIEYWKQREEEIMRRRKVDKKQFLGQNAQLFFENTFAHRGQVVGQIQKRNANQENKS